MARLKTSSPTRRRSRGELVSTIANSPLRALDETELPRRDSAIVVGVTAAIVGLLVLWMTQSGSSMRETPAEDPAAPTTIVAGE